MALYTAKSLNEIADQFDLMGRKAVEQSKTRLRTKQKEADLVAFAVWRAAADFLRNTEIEEIS